MRPLQPRVLEHLSRTPAETALRAFCCATDAADLRLIHTLQVDQIAAVVGIAVTMVSLLRRLLSAAAAGCLAIECQVFLLASWAVHRRLPK